MAKDGVSQLTSEEQQICFALSACVRVSALCSAIAFPQRADLSCAARLSIVAAISSSFAYVQYHNCISLSGQLCCAEQMNT